MAWRRKHKDTTNIVEFIDIDFGYTKEWYAVTEEHVNHEIFQFLSRKMVLYQIDGEMAANCPLFLSVRYRDGTFKELSLIRR